MLRFMSSIVVFRKEIYSLDSYQVPILSEAGTTKCAVVAKIKLARFLSRGVLKD